MALGLTGDSWSEPSPAAIVDRIQSVATEWNERLKQELIALGVEFWTGVASFETASTIRVTGKGGEGLTLLEADAIVVASGSIPRFPAEMRPDGQRVLAPRFAGQLRSLPPSIVVIGGGATGSEFSYLFNRMGVDVTWMVSERGVLPMFAPGAGEFLANALVKRGVKLIRGQRAESIERYEQWVTIHTQQGPRFSAAAAFLAIGRLPDTGRLNLGAAGLQPEPDGSLSIDAFGRTANPTIYAAGDVTGLPMLANQATIQGWIAGSHAAGATVPAYQPKTTIHAVYTEPQVAQVGVVAPAEEGVLTKRMPYSASLKAHLLPEQSGYIELTFATETGRVLGGVAVGHHAADVLAPVAVAVRSNATIKALGASGGANPAISELAFIAARHAVVRPTVQEPTSSPDS
jgi:dihydrolipoamide dehydrogenase